MFQSKVIVARPIRSFKVGAFWTATGREHKLIGRNFVAINGQRVVTGQHSGTAKQSHVFAKRVLQDGIVLSGKLEWFGPNLVRFSHVYRCLESEFARFADRLSGIGVTNQ